MARKVIVPLQFLPRSGDEPGIYGVRESYLRKIAKYRLTPLFVAPLMSREALQALYEEADGALFIGGADVHPRYYGAALEERTKVSEPDRDALELELLGRILEDRKPFFGICRGCQMLAVAGKGTLLQDIPGHRAESYAAMALAAHTVVIDKDSRAYSILGTGSIEVNSSHHQAVDSPGPDFAVSGRAEDGVAEILEHRDSGYFCFGVQAHPESMTSDPFEPLLAAFTAALHGQSL